MTTTDTCPTVHAVFDLLVHRYGLAPEPGADFRVFLQQSPWEDLLVSRRDGNWLIEIGYVVRGRPDGVICLIADSRGDEPETWHPVGIHQLITARCGVHGAGQLSAATIAEIRDYAEQVAGLWQTRLVAGVATVDRVVCPPATAVRPRAGGVEVVVLPPTYQ